jgi:hypothetical protein
MNLIDTRKEKLVIENVKILRDLWVENGWDLAELEEEDHTNEKEGGVVADEGDDHGHR